MSKSRYKLVQFVCEIGAEKFADLICDLKDETIQDQIVDAMNFYEKDGSSWYRPEVYKPNDSMNEDRGSMCVNCGFVLEKVTFCEIRNNDFCKKCF